MRNSGSSVSHEIASEVADYVSFGFTPSVFILSILSNDLRAAAESCPKLEIPRFWETVNYCFRECPPSACGSIPAVEAWLRKFKKERKHDLSNQTPC